MTGAVEHRRIGATTLLVGLGAILVASVLVALAVGAVEVAPAAVVGILLDHLGFETGFAFTETQDAVVWSIRLPRVLLALHEADPDDESLTLLFDTHPPTADRLARLEKAMQQQDFKKFR
ncbi:MAG: hypothetical protein R3290_13420, partial [Acidimicrobiia bacterium]|nr:hypothetical protein [Acidimicrobiia bacterium]